MYTQNEHSIEHVDIDVEMKRAYIDYSMSVIVGRALPDVRDGLKPGNRRILFAMHERGWQHQKPFVKCAKVVGEVIGNYHPHGDSAVYDTLVRMGQDFSMRYMLIHGQGNFGSIDGDPPAAYRYTECKLQRMAEELLSDIQKRTVDMRPNFDETLQEPVVLPSRMPNLLANGSTGIAVGMATNIPPHNLNELVEGFIHLIDHPEATVADLMQFIHGPDFPTGGVICGLTPIRDMYETGRGLLKVRGRAIIEENEQGKDRIIIQEIPYTVNKQTLIEKMADLVHEKKLEGISDIRDESDKDGIRVVIELKKGIVPTVVLNNIYKHTPLESTFGAIMLAIDRNRPRLMTLKDMMQCFIDHRFDVITRRTQFDLEKAEARAHILEGLKIALDHLDEVVRTIRESNNRDTARAQLMAKFGLSELQTNAILEMRLYQLTGLERDKIENEYLEVIKLINYLRDLLQHPVKIFGLIKDDLLELKKTFGDERRTALVHDPGEINIKDLIADESCVITITHGGYIKRVPLTTYRQQRRGGKGVLGMNTKDEDYVEHVFMASTHDRLLFFTEQGQVHVREVYEVPEGGRTARGKALVNLLNIESAEKIAAMIRIREFDEQYHLVKATEKGTVKKTNLSEYRNIRASGLIAIRIEEGDRLIGVRLVQNGQDVILSTRKGMSIRFGENQLRDQGRATIGVKGISLGEGDYVESLEVVEDNETLLVVTENGYGKRTLFDEYRTQHRGGKGLITIRGSERNGEVVGALSVHENDSIMLITSGGQMIRTSVAGIRAVSRNTMGVRLIDLAEDDKLVSVTSLEPEDDEGFEEGEESESPAKPEAVEGGLRPEWSEDAVDEDEAADGEATDAEATDGDEAG